MKLRYYLRGLAVGILVTTLILTIANAGRNRPLSDVEVRRRALELGMVDGDSAKLSLQPGRNDGNAGGGSTAPGNAGSTGGGSTAPGNAGSAGGGSTAPGNAGSTGGGSTAPGNAGSTGGGGTAPGNAGSAGGGGTAPGNAGSTGGGSTAPGSDGVPVSEGPGTDAGNAVSPTGAESPAGLTEPEHAGDSMEAESGTDREELTPITIEIRGGATSYTVSKDLAAAGLVKDALSFDEYLCNHGYARTVRTGIYKIYPGTSEEEIAKMIAQ